MPPGIDALCLLDAVSCDLLLIDPAGSLLWANRAARAKLEKMGFDGHDPMSFLDRLNLADEHGTPLNPPASGRLPEDSRRSPFRVRWREHGDYLDRWNLVHLHAVEGSGGRYYTLVRSEEITGEKVSQQALLDSETRYRNLVEHGGAVVLELSLDGVILYASPRLEQLTGIRPADIIGSFYFEVVHPADRETVRKTFAGRLEGKSGPAEFRIPCPGEDRWFRSYAEVVKRSDGTEALVGFMFDITSRREAEERARRLQRAMDATHDAIFILDSDGVVIDANDAALTLRETDRKADLCGQPISEMLGEASRNALDQERERLGRAGVTGIREYDVVTVTGRTKHCEGSLAGVGGETGRTEGSVLIVRDISERKRASDALKASERKYRLIFESTQTGILTSDLGGRITGANRAACRILGVDDPCEIRNRPTSDFFVDREQQAAMAQQIESGRRVSAAEVRLRSRRGDDVTVVADVTVETDEDGQARQIHRLLSDVTIKRRLEKNLVETTDRERRRIGQDLHDGLGQQLTGVAFLSKVLCTKLEKEDHPELEKAERIVDIINTSIANVRALSRGIYPFELESAGLSGALRQLCGSVEETFQISCAIDVGKAIPALPSHTARHLFSIAKEAVNNAIRHGKPTRVALSLHVAENGDVRLEIADDGVGLEESGRNEPGLGIAMMQSRAELIGGELRFRPRDGGGTIVSVAVAMGD